MVTDDTQMEAQSIDGEIARYLRTGESDPYCAAWPGAVVERVAAARADLREALAREVRRLAQAGSASALPDVDIAAHTRRKVAPMVRGLFSRAEQEVVLELLERSVVFVTSETIGPLIAEASWNGSAWDLANLYLASVDAPLLGDDAPALVGISEETTCYVSVAYFDDDDPFADFIVHEAAHIFHNCKRGSAGLKQTHTREWLLDIEYTKRETFAYACEVYARILERGTRPAERIALAAEFAKRQDAPDDRVDPQELAHIVSAAASARNGWKRIYARCAKGAGRGAGGASGAG